METTMEIRGQVTAEIYREDNCKLCFEAKSDGIQIWENNYGKFTMIDLSVEEVSRLLEFLMDERVRAVRPELPKFLPYQTLTVA